MILLHIQSILIFIYRKWTNNKDIYFVITRIFEYFCLLGHEYNAIHKAYVLRFLHDMTNDYKSYFKGKEPFLVKWIKMLADSSISQSMLKFCVNKGIKV